MQDQLIMAIVGVVGGFAFIYLWVWSFISFELSKMALDETTEIHRSLRINGLSERWKAIAAMMLVALAWPYLYVKIGRGR